MKRLFIVVLCIAHCALCIDLKAQDKKDEQPLRYVNATEFRIINKGFFDTETTYSRLPIYLKDSVRADLWDRGLCSAGVAIRFATDSKRVGVRYRLLKNFHMYHMADTGTKGADLYIRNEKGKWEYVNTCRPMVKDKETKECEKVFVDNFDGTMHEFIIYLPLYDGVTEMFVAVDSTATLTQPQVDSPRKDKRIVMYGTSVLQGGCATRTGMAGTNIIQRDLNCEVINLGFSGEGKMDMCIARAMAQIPNVACYVLDPVPNCTEQMCDTLTYAFVSELHRLRPEVPIVMVEGHTYTYAKYDTFFKDYLPKKNAAWLKNYKKLKKDGIKNLYYVTTEGLFGYDNEGTVDGIHYTDLGYRHYAQKLEKVVKRFVK